jgi:membrane-bound serine protease (ClpP class)
MKWSVFAAFFACLVSVNQLSAQDLARSGKTALVLTIDGPIDPISARYLEHGLAKAQADGDELVVIVLDTSNGLQVSMNWMVEEILSSPVPVSVFVSPSGARAASAGVFLAMAAHIAVMAPGTNIGAARPIAAGGGDVIGMEGRNIVNDSIAALARTAALRGRDPAWAEDAVGKNLSLTDSEAVRRHVVDLEAPDLHGLLSALDGMTVRTVSGEKTLHTAGAEVRVSGLRFIDRLLSVLMNPDLAYILLVVGILGIIFELTVPGSLAGGVAGGIALLLSLIGFGSLPTNIGGVLLIALAVILFIVDIKAPTHGVITFGGIISFALGSFLLFPWWLPAAPPSAPEVRVSPITIGIMTSILTLFFLFVISKGAAALSRGISFGEETLVGSWGETVTELVPEGQIRTAGEVWSAYTDGEKIGVGEAVEVIGRDGLRLIVRRATALPGKEA